MKRFLLWTAAGITICVLALLWIAQSEWLRDRIRRQVIEQAERATGGRVELGGFAFDWRSLTAEFDNIVIHGTESATQAPLLSVKHTVIGFSVISLMRSDFAIRFVRVELPAAHVIVLADGTTNLPRPKTAGKPLDESILNLRIGQFDLSGGALQVDREGEPKRIVPWNAHGRNLTAKASFDAARVRYTGTLSADPLLFTFRGSTIPARVVLNTALERGRVLVPSAHLEGDGASVDLTDGMLTTAFTATYRAQYRARGWQGHSEGTIRIASASDYAASGRLEGTGRGISGSGQFELLPSLLTVREAHVTGYGGDAQVNGELRAFEDWRVAGIVRHVHVAALPVKLPWDGFLSGNIRASGDLRRIAAGDFQGDLKGPSANGAIDVHYTGSTLAFGHSWVELPHTRIDLAGTLGERLTVRLQSSDMSDLAPLMARQIPSGAHLGQLAFEGSVSGALNNPRIVGHVSAKEIDYAGQHLDSLAGDLSLASESAGITAGSGVYGGIPFRIAGTLGLKKWEASDASPLSATLQTRDADLTRVLALAGHKEVEVSGALTLTAAITGTPAQPRAQGEVSLAHGLIYGQPFDSIGGQLEAGGRDSQNFTGLFVSGAKRVNFSTHFTEAGTRFPAGVLEFNATSNTMPLNQIALIRARQPDIRGFGKFHADGSLRISHDAKHELQYDLLALNSDAAANSLELAGRTLGDARLTTQTKDGVLTAHFDSDAGKGSTRGDASVRLTGEYPLEARITFSYAALNALAVLAASPGEAANVPFDGAAQGEISLHGPLRRPGEIVGDFNVGRLELFALSRPDLRISNNGALRGSIDSRSLRLSAVRLTAPQTDLSIGGSVALSGQAPLNVSLRGTMNLAIAGTFIPDLNSTGTLNIDAGVKGAWATPDFSGRATMHNADFRYADFSNGLTNANGDFIFTGTRATIRSFTADSGGGKVDASGFAAVSGSTLAFRLEANAHAVRVRYPEGVSSVSDAHFTLAGTSERSLASGLVTIHRVAINPRSDTASILASAAQPVQTPGLRSGLIANMNLDVQIQTAPDVTLETSVTQTIQADANLRLRGTVTNPALLGRINITQGELIFFGNRYTINRGAISFYNPVKIDPILNIDLETKARGVDVILTVTGPIAKLNVSYRSDPPLQFSDIVALLATGRTPTDPTSAVRDATQSQSFGQLGASALLGQAIANPVAGRLQRFFGVSRLKIDPQLTGITGSPQARLTIEQQVTPDILFTYITDVSSTSTQLIRVEWAWNRHWSAIVTREENGYVGLDFAYKKRFR